MAGECTNGKRERGWRAVMPGVQNGQVLRKGAEATLVKGTWLGSEAVFKIRARKAYRHPVLDEKLRRERTVGEARVLGTLLQAGIPVPCLLEVNVKECFLVMEFVPGQRLKDAIPDLEKGTWLEDVMERVGYHVAGIHEINYIHGDITTSNIIYDKGNFKLIDFGLARHTTNVEDKAVDLHLFKRVLTSTHAHFFDRMFPPFMAGYKKRAAEKQVNDSCKHVLDRMEKIQTRGRYVEKRKRT